MAYEFKPGPWVGGPWKPKDSLKAPKSSYLEGFGESKLNPSSGGGTMSDTVTLSQEHGNYKSGDVFEVVRRASATTIAKDKTGKRIILPNTKLVEKSGTPVPSEPKAPRATVKLNPTQMVVLNSILADEDYEDILQTYMTNTGFDEKVAKADIVFIAKEHERGSLFQLEGASEPPETPVPGASVSAEELSVLQELLTGTSEAWDSEVLKPGETEAPEEAAPVLSPNQVWLTDITGGRLPKTGINHLIQQYPEDHFPEEIRIDIPKVRKDHYWDANVLEALVLAHQLREKALITGLPGTGKSSSVEQFAAWIRQPYMRLGGRGDLESSSFLGYAWADVEEINGESFSKMVFRPGMLTQGLNTQGFGYLVTIDEVMKIPSYIQMSMQHLYEKDGFLTIDDKPGTKADKIVRPAPEFLMILTDNVKGTGDNFDKFSATQMQDTSSLDRISINETLDYLDPADEAEMLKAKYPSVSRDIILKLVKFAGLVRNGYKVGSIALTLSPRGLIAILDMMNAGLPVVRAIELAYTNKIADDAELLSIRDMVRTVNLS